MVAVNVTHVKVGPTSSGGDLGNAGYSVSAYNNWISQQQSVTRRDAGPTRICPYVPVATIGGLPQPAEILVINPDPSKIVLGVMK